jgi:hypothetical protein
LVGAVRPGTTEVIDRFRLRSVDAQIPPLGSEVLVEGSIVSQGSNRVVIAANVTVLLEPPEPFAPEPSAGGTHASPTAHARRGHWRRLGRGTTRERMVWVRSTTVGEPDCDGSTS